MFVVTLMLPDSVQFSNIFNGHEHVACKEQATHIHADIQDCQICHFHLASFNDELTKCIELLIVPVPEKVESQFAYLPFLSFIKTNTQLRAPPYFLG
jgi:hypothetical protein